MAKVRNIPTSEHMLATNPLARADAWPGMLRTILLVVVLFLFALAPRALAPGDFVTTDEPDWFMFSEDFLTGLEQGRYELTRPLGHPGVTTMWLGTGGLLTYRSLVAAGWVTPDDQALQRRLLRLPVALLTALSVALVYLLLRRLIGTRKALLATLLWASDPFLVAHSKVLHVDALLTTFITLSLLTALLAVRFDDETPPANDANAIIRWPWLIASAVAGGLALLTKSPAIMLVPLVGLIILVGCWRYVGWTGEQQSWQRLRVVAVPVIAALLVWLVVTTFVWVAVWPSAWTDLPATVMKVVEEVRDNGAKPHEGGNFFLGRPVDDPGPLFYPIAMALRLTPWTLLGLLLAVAAAMGLMSSTFARNRLVLTNPRQWVYTLLALFVLLFVLIMSALPKKFDRYALPVFPALNILAAAGWIWLLDWVVTRLSDIALRRRRIQMLTWCVISLGLMANLTWYHPYYLAYYNPLLGGATTATRAIVVGWGEGLEQVGAFITSQPDGCDRPVASRSSRGLQPYICTWVVPMSEIQRADSVRYAVVYINNRQREHDSAELARLRQMTPLHTVQIHGIDYAYVYQVPRPVAHALDADFGSALHLRGYDLDPTLARATSTLTLTLHWQASTMINTVDYMLFIHVFDAGGQRVAQVDVPPGGLEHPLASWKARQYVTQMQRIPLPTGLPAGEYWLALGVYDPNDFVRLPLQGPSQSDHLDTGPDALLIGPIELK